MTYFSFLDVASWNCDGAKGENGVPPLHLNNQQPLTTFGNHHNHNHGQMLHTGLLGRSDNLCDGRSSPPNHLKNGYLNSSQSVHAVTSSSHFQSQPNMTFTTSNDVNAASCYGTSSPAMSMQEKVDRGLALHAFPPCGAGEFKYQQVEAEVTDPNYLFKPSKNIYFKA